MKRGAENGVDGLRVLDGSEAMKMEPELQCVKALLSPASGIVDSHSLMLSLVGCQPNVGPGGKRKIMEQLSLVIPVIGGHLEGNCMNLHITETRDHGNWNGVSPTQPDLILTPKLVVNSAGLSAPALVKRFIGLDNDFIPPAYYARGCYFTLANTKGSPFEHLIYPIPEDGGLGVHVTLDLDGQMLNGSMA